MTVLAPALLLAPLSFCAVRADDPRDIRNGHVIPDEGYCDQPYVVVLPDGTWLCVMTTGAGEEGQRGQHVVSTRSTDHGATWSALVDLEPADGPEASWAMPVLAPDGRVHAFYVYNGEEVGGRRADMLGWYCWRSSDDGGRTWSERRRLPLRETAVDRANDFGGEPQIFWGIGKPVVVGDDVWFGLTKVGQYMLDQSEGWFFHSANLLVERDPARVAWELLPDGDHGLRAPEHGSVQSEQNLAPLAEGGLLCMYRTTMGYPCQSVSRDGGHTWSTPEAATYEPGGRRFKHPRACPRLWRTGDGRYLFWFHHNGARDWAAGTRNPAWVVGGVERDGVVHWSQPEILLYDRDPLVRISYPDLIEQDGRVWVTETQKSVARVHEVDVELLEGLWTQGLRAETPRDAVLLEVGSGSVLAPEWPDLDMGGGVTLECWIELPRAGERALVTSSDAAWSLVARADGSVSLDLGTRAAVEPLVSDPGLLAAGVRHHVVAIADGAPGILTWIVDGVMCDGGAERLRGWQRLRATADAPEALGAALRSSSGAALVVDPAVGVLRVHGRALRTSEAIASFHAGE